jgi:hypothetical protein
MQPLGCSTFDANLVPQSYLTNTVNDGLKEKNIETLKKLRPSAIGQLALPLDRAWISSNYNCRD